MVVQLKLQVLNALFVVPYSPRKAFYPTCTRFTLILTHTAADIVCDTIRDVEPKIKKISVAVLRMRLNYSRRSLGQSILVGGTLLRPMKRYFPFLLLIVKFLYSKVRRLL